MRSTCKPLIFKLKLLHQAKVLDVFSQLKERQGSHPFSGFGFRKAIENQNGSIALFSQIYMMKIKNRKIVTLKAIKSKPNH